MELVLDLNLENFVGLEHYIGCVMEPPTIIFGNSKRPKVPKDWERRNAVLLILVKKGQRLTLVILSCSFNIWEILC